METNLLFKERSAFKVFRNFKMKLFLPFILFNGLTMIASAQNCSTYSNVSNFGVDGDLYTNFPSVFPNADGWFPSGTGTGEGVIGAGVSTSNRNLSAAEFRTILSGAGQTGRNTTYQQGMAYSCNK